jgi:hypothetical protein
MNFGGQCCQNETAEDLWSICLRGSNYFAVGTHQNQAYLAATDHAAWIG